MCEIGRSITVQCVQLKTNTRYGKRTSSAKNQESHKIDWMRGALNAWAIESVQCIFVYVCVFSHFRDFVGRNTNQWITALLFRHAFDLAWQNICLSTILSVRMNITASRSRERERFYTRFHLADWRSWLLFFFCVSFSSIASFFPVLLLLSPFKKRK